MHILRRLGVLGLLGISLCVFGSCELEPVLQPAVDKTLDEMWGTAWVKKSLEANAQDALHKGLKKFLVGKKFYESWFVDVYIQNVKWTKLNLGNKAPKLDVHDIVWAETANYYYLSIPWFFDWPKPNGCEIKFFIDLTSWFGFPDHTVRLYDLKAWMSGHTMVAIPKTLSGQGSITSTVRSSTLDLKAEAEGWFWTFDISVKVKKLVQEVLLEYLVGQSFEKVFGPLF